MESTRDIKGRIKSVTNIQQITKAMKMVAAARLRKAEEKANGSRPYAEKIGELLRRASSVTPDFTSSLFRTGKVKKVGYLVISADKGLAGAFNSNVMKRTLQEISGRDRSEYALYVCGKQGRNYLKFRGYDLDSYHFGFSDKPTAQDSIDLAKEMVDYFVTEEVDEVYVIYTKFITALHQQVLVEKILPVEAPEADEETGNGSEKKWKEAPYIFMPDAYTVLPDSFRNTYRSRFTTPCSSPLLPNLEAVWLPCPLQPTTLRKESPTSTSRTTKHVRLRSPTKFPKSSAAQLRLNKPLNILRRNASSWQMNRRCR